MSLPRSLLPVVVVVVWVVVIGTEHLCVAQSFCPDPNDIAPCTCSGSAEYSLFIDCSKIVSSAQLAEIFQKPFPYNDFRMLTIKPADPTNSLTDLPGGVFGDKTFQKIYISNTTLHTVEELALVASNSTLRTLNLSLNEVSSFPFQTLELFTVLQHFDMSLNKLTGPLPDIVSESLLQLFLSGNKGLTLTNTTFVGAPNVTWLELKEMSLSTTMPANIFLPLQKLRFLFLEFNDISGTLSQDFINNEQNVLTGVQLDGNSISSIHPLSVTGMSVSGTISFRGNLIEYLPEEEWDVLVSQFTEANAIDVRFNPLVCGCDLMWLVFDSTLMSIFHNETTCVTGDYIVDLSQQWFLENCALFSS